MIARIHPEGHAGKQEVEGATPSGGLNKKPQNSRGFLFPVEAAAVFLSTARTEGGQCPNNRVGNLRGYLGVDCRDGEGVAAGDWNGRMTRANRLLHFINSAILSLLVNTMNEPDRRSLHRAVSAFKRVLTEIGPFGVTEERRQRLKDHRLYDLEHRMTISKPGETDRLAASDFQAIHVLAEIIACRYRVTHVASSSSPSQHTFYRWRQHAAAEEK